MANQYDKTGSGSRDLMSTILAPAASVMNRLRYVQKFVLIGLLLLAPMAFVAYLQFSQATHDIDFNVKETIGVSYITPARDFLQEVQNHRILAAAVASGDLARRGELQQCEARADEAEAEVDKVEAAHGEALRTGPKWASVKSAWAGAKGNRSADMATILASHERATSGTIDLILNYAGNNSNLILDPDLDSYWLMDAFVVKLPLLPEIVDRATATSLQAIARGGLTAEERISLAGDARQIESTMSDLLNVNVKTAYQENKSGTVKPAIDGDVNRASQAVNDYLAFLSNRFLRPEHPTASADELLRTRRAASEALFGLYQSVGPQLNGLCQTRVDNYRGARTLGVTLTFLAAALLVYVFGGFYSSIKQSLTELAGVTRRMIVGTSETIALTSQDEVGELAKSYNEINKTLVEARQRASQEQEENRLLQENIMNLLMTVAKASQGDLTVRAQVTTGSLGSVADAFNAMLDSWRDLLGEVTALIGRTNQAVANIKNSSESMAQGATQQVNEITRATELVRGVTASLQQVSQNAEHASTAASRTQESAEAGTESVQNVVQGMQSLRANVQAGAKKIKSLGDRSMEITGIVNTIAKISDQTNMLALNAAIEAARAGEHGRGFSVVADQVRQLAERVAGATQEIEALVRMIHAETNESVEAIEQQTAIVENEAQVVSQAGKALLKIRDASTESSQLVGDITQLAKKQVQGAQDVAQTMDQVSQIARLTKTGTEDSLRITDELASLSDQLQRTMAKFQVA